jgi:RNA polymerase sigma-70 factor (ECF subfamily)
MITGRSVASAAEADASAIERDPGNVCMLALQRGDMLALQQLFSLYNSRLFSFLLRILGDVQTAEDVLQETWLTLYEHRSSYKPTHRFSTWIFTVARRKALSELRRRKVRSIVRSMTASDGEAMNESMEFSQRTFSSPDASADDAIFDALVERALGRLTEHQREIVMLRDVEGFDNEEIAGILQWNLKPGAIRKRVFDAREAFRKAMLELGYNED